MVRILPAASLHTVFIVSPVKILIAHHIDKTNAISNKTKTTTFKIGPDTIYLNPIGIPKSIRKAATIEFIIDMLPKYLLVIPKECRTKMTTEINTNIITA
jgi:hypothetical protein